MHEHFKNFWFFLSRTQLFQLGLSIILPQSRVTWDKPWSTWLGFICIKYCQFDQKPDVYIILYNNNRHCVRDLVELTSDWCTKWREQTVPYCIIPKWLPNIHSKWQRNLIISVQSPRTQRVCPEDTMLKNETMGSLVEHLSIERGMSDPMKLYFWVIRGLYFSVPFVGWSKKPLSNDFGRMLRASDPQISTSSGCPFST